MVLVRAIGALLENMRRRFELDSRALAGMRVFLGFFTLMDLLERLRNFTAHYTSEGMVPWSFFWGSEGMAHWSIHPLFMNPMWQATLFGTSIIAAGCLMVGYRTRLAAGLLFVLMFSLHNFVPPMLHHSDVLQRILLFWCLFTATNRHYSVDLRLGRATPPTQTTLFNVATIALVIQVVAIYHGASISKWNDAWTYDGDALHFVLQWDLYVTPLGAYLQKLEWLTPILTVGTWCLQLVAPALILLPVRTHWIRALTAVALMGLHLGMLPFMDLGGFAYITVIMLMSLLPGQWYDAAFSKLPSRLRALLQPGDREPLPKDFPKPVRLTASVAWSAVGVSVVALCIYANLHKNKELPKGWANWAGPLMKDMGLAQSWSMFRTGGYNKSGLIKRDWLVIPATYKNGDIKDLFRGGEPVEWTPPKNVSSYYTSDRWRTFWERPKGRYLGGIVGRAYIREALSRYGRHLCRESDEAMTSVAFHHMTETGYGTGEYRKRTLQTWSCGCLEVTYRHGGATQTAMINESITDLRKVCIDAGVITNGECTSLNDLIVEAVVQKGRTAQLYRAIAYKGQKEDRRHGQKLSKSYRNQVSSIRCNPDF